MSGGKGGSQTQRVEIPAWMEDVAKRNLARAEAMSKVGYQPYYGTDVVGFDPTGDMARQANIDAAIAFGMAPEGTRATPMGDMSSGTLYDQAVAEYERRNPGAASYYNQFFVDPVTGAAPLYDQAIAEQAARQEAMRQGRISPVLYDTTQGNSYTVDTFGKPMFTNEEFANFAVNMIPGVGAVRTVGGILDNLFGGGTPNTNAPSTSDSAFDSSPTTSEGPAENASGYGTPF